MPADRKREKRGSEVEDRETEKKGGSQVDGGVPAPPPLHSWTVETFREIWIKETSKVFKKYNFYFSHLQNTFGSLFVKTPTFCWNLFLKTRDHHILNEDQHCSCQKSSLRSETHLFNPSLFWSSCVYELVNVTLKMLK